MKLATLRDQTRDGQLVVVSRDLKTAVLANDASSTMQRALDDWTFAQPRLQALYDALNQGRLRHSFAFDITQAMAPLPRAFGWAAFDPWASTIEPVAWMADALLGARDPLSRDGRETTGFSAGLAAITGDVSRDADPADAVQALRLWMGYVAWHAPLDATATRGDAPNDEGSPGTADRHRAAPVPAGPVHVYPMHVYPMRLVAVQCTPVAVTTDELGEHWRTARPHLRLDVAINGRRVGRLLTGDDMRIAWPGLLTTAAAPRGLRAGVIVGAGPVRNGEKSRGYAHSAEEARPGPGADPLRTTDRFRADWSTDDGESMFGAIEVMPSTAPSESLAGLPAGSPGDAGPGPSNGSPVASHHDAATPTD